MITMIAFLAGAVLGCAFGVLLAGLLWSSKHAD